MIQAMSAVSDTLVLPEARADLGALLAATAAGDQRAFAQLYQAVSAQLFGLLLRMLRRRDWAEEALQDCLLRVWQKADTYAPDKGAPLAWLMSIARYRALDLLRARRPELGESEGEASRLAFAGAVDASQDPAARAAEAEGVGQIGRCLETLTDEQRRSVLLAYYEGYTHHELARALAAPVGTVKSWVRRGLARLRECLGP